MVYTEHLGEMLLILFLKCFYMRTHSTWDRQSPVFYLHVFAVLNVFMKSKRFSWLGSNGKRMGEEEI